MVFLNYSAMQMVAKIVYYGPGLCGKTTNLQTIYKNTDERARGEMVSLATETDRTLFFDLLPMEVGVIGGFKTKFQLYTVPGQVFYNTTRKLVLRGVDGIVFVADSQLPMMEANKESFNNLEENLAELNLSVRDIPLVMQYNKRDLPNVAPVGDMNRYLNGDGRPYVEASALKGIGVFETLREISKQTLIVLNKKTLGNPATAEHPHGGSATREAPPATAPERLETNNHAPPTIDDSDTFSDELEDPDSSFEGTDAEFEEKDTFEQTLENMELDFDEDEDIEEDTFDISDFDDLEDTEDVAEEPSLEVEASEDPSLEEEPEVPPLVEEEPEEPSLEFEESEEPSLEVEESEESVFELEDREEPPFALELDEEPLAVEDEDDVADEELELGDEEEDETEAGDDVPSLPPEPEVVPVEKPPAPILEITDLDRPAPPPRPKRKPRKTADPSVSLEDLRTMTMRAGTKGKKKEPKSVDSLLEGLVEDKKAKRKKIHVKAPFAKAQVNCVFLDEEENVVDTRLVLLDPEEISQGHYRLEIKLDIEVDDSVN